MVVSRDANRAVVAKVYFGPGAEGPPGHAHEGSIAATMDEAMVMAAWLVGYRKLRKIELRFRGGAEAPPGEAAPAEALRDAS